MKIHTLTTILSKGVCRESMLFPPPPCQKNVDNVKQH